jgi:hypothetical protein
MTFPYISIENFLPFYINPESIFLEIGSECGAGSTAFLANLAKKYNVTLHSVDIDDKSDLIEVHSSLQLHIAKGSDWCQKVLPTLKKSISFVYLDNFDIIWDTLMTEENFESAEWNSRIYNDLKGELWPQEFTPWHKMPVHLKEEVCNQFGKKGRELKDFKKLNDSIKMYREKFGLELNNNNCQIEHLKQLLVIEPYLDQHCTVLFDDTFTVEDCWSGKCGPCVIYLQCLGFKIQQVFSNGVVLTR